MSWTHLMCVACWIDKNPGRQPHRLSEPQKETCAWCGKENTDGIYMRADPKTVPYLSKD